MWQGYFYHISSYGPKSNIIQPDQRRIAYSVHKMDDHGDIPPVVFDTTLYDLLKAENPDGEVETICQFKPNSNHQFKEALPFSDKYIIHSAQSEDHDDMVHLQLEDCCHVLNFWIGAVNVLYLACEGHSEDETMSQEQIHANALKAASVIQPSQRPNITTFRNTEDMLLNHDGTKIRWAFAMDLAERLPYNLHPEVTYELNSKRWLGLTDIIRSANDVVIDPQINCPDHQQITPRHKKEWYYGGKDCEKCDTGVKAEVERVVKILNDRPAPWVLKLTQSLSSVGTLIAKDDEEKAKQIDTARQYLTDYLPRVTKYNAHLYTTSLILSDFIPSATAALNFFIRKDGSAIFLGACEQLSTGETGRQATAIFYDQQEKLEKKYLPTLNKIGQTLKDYNYYGPVGADIMEDEEGRLYTIDLNVRTPLSLVLYNLKSHFTSRGLNAAIVFECIQLGIPREKLEELFAKEFREARIIITGSFQFGHKQRWAYGMIVAGEDRKSFDALVDRILEHEAGVADV